MSKNSEQSHRGSKEIRIIFNEDITRVPSEVSETSFTVKGKIVEIEE